MMVETPFQTLSDDHHLAIVTQLELRQSNKDFRLRINDVLKGYLQLIDNILIRRNRNMGNFQANSMFRLARQMIFGTIDETVTTWVMNEEKYDLSGTSSSRSSVSCFMAVEEGE